MTQAVSLMTDQFGNYVIQKLLDHGGPKVPPCHAAARPALLSEVLHVNSTL